MREEKVNRSYEQTTKPIIIPHVWKSHLPEAAALLTVLALALALRLIFITGVVFFDDVAYAQAAHNLTLGVLRFAPWPGGLSCIGMYFPAAPCMPYFAQARLSHWP